MGLIILNLSLYLVSVLWRCIFNLERILARPLLRWPLFLILHCALCLRVCNLLLFYNWMRPMFRWLSWLWVVRNYRRRKFLTTPWTLSACVYLLFRGFRLRLLMAVSKDRLILTLTLMLWGLRGCRLRMYWRPCKILIWLFRLVLPALVLRSIILEWIRALRRWRILSLFRLRWLTMRWLLLAWWVKWVMPLLISRMWLGWIGIGRLIWLFWKRLGHLHWQWWSRLSLCYLWFRRRLRMDLRFRWILTSLFLWRVRLTMCCMRLLLLLFWFRWWFCFSWVAGEVWLLFVLLFRCLFWWALLDWSLLEIPWILWLWVGCHWPLECWWMMLRWRWRIFIGIGYWANLWLWLFWPGLNRWQCLLWRLLWQFVLCFFRWFYWLVHRVICLPRWRFRWLFLWWPLIFYRVRW